MDQQDKFPMTCRVCGNKSHVGIFVNGTGDFHCPRCYMAKFDSTPWYKTVGAWAILLILLTAALTQLWHELFR